MEQQCLNQQVENTALQSTPSVEIKGHFFRFSFEVSREIMPDSDSGVLPPCRNFQRFRRIIKIVRNLPVHLHVIFLQTGDCVSVFRLQKNLYSVMFARVNLVMRLACRPGFRYLMTAYSNLNSRKARGRPSSSSTAATP